MFNNIFGTIGIINQLRKENKQKTRRRIFVASYAIILATIFVTMFVDRREFFLLYAN